VKARSRNQHSPTGGTRGRFSNAYLSTLLYPVELLNDEAIRIVNLSITQQQKYRFFGPSLTITLYLTQSFVCSLFGQSPLHLDENVLTYNKICTSFCPVAPISNWNLAFSNPWHLVAKMTGEICLIFTFLSEAALWFPISKCNEKSR
jgi:hypothetical protein